MASRTLSQPLVTASELRELAQCALAAAVMLERKQLTDNAQSIFGAWCKALPLIRKLTGEFPDSTAAIVIRRAVGMVMRHREAFDLAALEMSSALSVDDVLKERLADAKWRSAGLDIADIVIGAYHTALEARQS